MKLVSSPLASVQYFTGGTVDEVVENVERLLLNW